MSLGEWTGPCAVCIAVAEEKHENRDFQIKMQEKSVFASKRKRMETMEKKNQQNLS